VITTPHILGQHFAYAIGRLGVLNDQLLTQTDIDRLLGAPSGAEAVKMLRDIAFVASPEINEPFLETLDATTRLLKENIEKMAPSEKHSLFHILWIEGDRALISYSLKKKHGFTSGIAVEPEPPVTVWSKETWENKFPELLEAGFSSPMEIDALVATVIHTYQSSLAQHSGSRLIQQYVAILQSNEEQRTYIRGLDSVTHEEYLNFEKASATLDILTQMQNIILGPEPLFAYAVRALNHIALLKVLLTGKVNHVPIQEIKALLPPLL
jgi:vacuolar-type H+-ATPase subunit C/Vma6